MVKKILGKDRTLDDETFTEYLYAIGISIIEINKQMEEEVA